MSQIEERHSEEEEKDKEINIGDNKELEIADNSLKGNNEIESLEFVKEKEDQFFKTEVVDNLKSDENTENIEN